MNKDLKILVTGVKGQLGYDRVRELKERGYANVLGIDREELDITDREAVLKFIADYHPDVIIHNAAYTAVDKAEENKDACHAVNVLGVRYLTEAASLCDAKLIYISTDYVFDGLGEVLNLQFGVPQGYELPPDSDSEGVAEFVHSRCFVLSIRYIKKCLMPNTPQK